MIELSISKDGFTLKGNCIWVTIIISILIKLIKTDLLALLLGFIN